MRSSRTRKSTTRRTLATRMQLKPALSRHTCHRATRRPQHGLSQLELGGGERRVRRGGLVSDNLALVRFKPSISLREEESVADIVLLDEE